MNERDDRFVIGLNREVQRLINLLGQSDPDDFGLRLSRQLSRSSRPRDVVDEASIMEALSSMRTSFFRVSGCSKRDFSKLLVERVRGMEISRESSLPEKLKEFAEYAERQLAQELWKGRKDESVLRSHLQTALEAGGRYTLKELTTGRGRTDIALLDEQGKAIIETKLWRGQEYFADGLAELAEYLRTEHLHDGYYVVLDCSLENKLVAANGSSWTELVDGRKIHVTFIRIPPASPSKLRKHSKRELGPS